MVKREPRIKIFVAHHKPGYIYEDDVYVPIQVGKKNAKVDLGILGDDTGDNISDKNDNYSELTAQYWVWKNYDLSDVDYVGFCHYRRYMTYCYKPNLWKYLFMKNPFNSLDTSFIWQTKSRHEGNCFFAYDDSILCKNTKNLVSYITRNKYDLYTVKRELYIVGNVYKMLGISVRTPNFCFGEDGHRKHIAKKIFLQMYPDFDSIVNEVQEERKYCYPLHRNMFIMRTSLFLKFVKRLFDYLFEVEKIFNEYHIQTIGIYGEGQNRFMGLLSEILINYRKLYEEKNRGMKVLSKSNLIFFSS